MKRILPLSLLAFLGLQLQAATITIKDDDLKTGTYDWTKDNVYLLDGFVFLESGGTLNIEAGTVIKAKETPSTSDNASALIVARGAKIYAEGTAEEPIIFTAELDDLADNADLDETDKGLWGGVIILGSGQLAFAGDTANIEGIPTTETRAVFGGQDNTDNSGTITYVSIRHGGAELAPGDEINGLTLGGVGSGTNIDFVEVFANSDDGVEWFGGAVGVKHLITAFCGDDGFDWDFGWRGKGQFWFGLQQADDGDNGGEHDGAKPDGEAGYTKPTIYNATYIGSGTNGTAKNSTALHFRDNCGGMYANSIFTDFANHAIEVEDLDPSKGADSRERMKKGDLQLLNNLWFGFGSRDEVTTDATKGIIRATTGDTADFLVDHLTNNKNMLSNPDLAGISRVFGDNSLDPRPNPSSPAWNTERANVPSGDNFFTDVNYKGAFGSANWATSWTALDAYGFFGNIVGIKDPSISVSNVSSYPNPTNGLTSIAFHLNSSQRVSIKVYDMTGKVVATILNDEVRGSGSQLVKLDASTLAGGLYSYVVTTEEGNFLEKMLITE